MHQLTQQIVASVLLSLVLTGPAAVLAPDAIPTGSDSLLAASDIGPFRELPSWLFEARFPGFPGETLPGERRHAGVDLIAGRYLIVSDVVQLFEVVETAVGPRIDPRPSTDKAIGMPHAVMGMLEVFTIGGDGGTPTVPPKTADMPSTTSSRGT